MLGGINIARESSRHSIEKKLKELEEQKDQGFITLEEYDTLRIRYERKLGNKETVSKLQEAKGFKPSSIKEKKAKKEELFDEFVDKYSMSEGKDYGEIQRSQIFSKTTTRTILVLMILLAFAVGIMAGVSTIGTVSQDNSSSNVTITDSAFSANATTIQASNATMDTSNITYNNTKKKTTKKKTTTKKTNYTSSSSDSKKTGSSDNKKSDSSNTKRSSSSSSSSSSRSHSSDN